MPNDADMNTEHHDAIYHDTHLDDDAEWDEASAEDVTPRPTGMTVFSLRLPRDEFRLLKQAAEERHTSMFELARAALRFYLAPRASGSLSATSLHHLQVTSYTPFWTGGMTDAPAHVETDRQIPVGNVIPR